MVHNETIRIEGTSATGQCSFEMPCALSSESYVCVGHYDEVLVKQEGEWKFKSRQVIFYYFVPLTEGWAGARSRPPLSTSYECAGCSHDTIPLAMPRLQVFPPQLPAGVWLQHTPQRTTVHG
jgi:hypothetical protein